MVRTRFLLSNDLARSSSSTALASLRALIRDLSTDGVDRLPPERDLAISMQVGRRAVRRAMEVLEAEGAVWRRQGRGTFIGNGPRPTLNGLALLSNRTSPTEIMEARLLLEPGLTRLAALRATGEDIEGLQRLARKTASAEDDDGMELWDGAFHRRIAEAAGNQTLAAIHDLLIEVRQRPDWQDLRACARTPERRARALRDHDEIVAAIARRDGYAAERAMLHHLTALDDNLRRQINGVDDAARAQPRGAPETGAAANALQGTGS